MKKPANLKELVERYYLWMEELGYSNRTIINHRCVLKYFQDFALNQKWSFKDALKLKNRSVFLMQNRLTKRSVAIKAIAAYIIHARPETVARNLFVSLSPPHKPVTGGLVSDAIGKAIKTAGVPGSAYWMRHTYAQNLLESGASIFEIKEMLGHDCIKATKRYLHIHIKLMREVLFDD